MILIDVKFEGSAGLRLLALRAIAGAVPKPRAAERWGFEGGANAGCCAPRHPRICEWFCFCRLHQPRLREAPRCCTDGSIATCTHPRCGRRTLRALRSSARLHRPVCTEGASHCTARPQRGGGAYRARHEPRSPMWVSLALSAPRANDSSAQRHDVAAHARAICARPALARRDGVLRTAPLPSDCASRCAQFAMHPTARKRPSRAHTKEDDSAGGPPLPFHAKSSSMLERLAEPAPRVSRWRQR